MRPSGETAGYAAPSVLALFAVSLVAGGPLGQIIQAGYAAFTSALHAALYLSAALLAGAALLSAVSLRQRRLGADRD